MNARERTEWLEEKILSEHAALSMHTVGREQKEPLCSIRTEFQRDKDRILHCNAFRRLKHKTQVFLSPRHDHYRTRLVHSLEVSQIARTLARGLALNEDLTEAIALGHDLGHAPFGHAGERALNDVCPDGFAHAQNSVRVVRKIEKEGKGLNLTDEVLDGIRCHTNGVAKTLEGRLVRISDKIAYVNHDIEDSIRAGILSNQDLPYDCVYILGNTKSKRITTMIQSILENSVDDITIEPTIYQAHMALREFMFKNVYEDPVAQKEQNKAEYIVREMYLYYKKHYHKMPAFYIQLAEDYGLDRGVCDYIAGMSDNYLVEKYMEVFVPKQWSI